MKKIFATILSAAMIVSNTAAFAEDEYSVTVKTDYSADVTTVEGDFGTLFSDRRVNIVVLNPGYSASDLGKVTVGAINWTAQKTLDTDGKFSVSMNLIPSEASAETEYTVLVAVDSFNEVIERSFELYNDKYVDTVVDEIKDVVSAKDSDGIGKIIEDYVIILDIANTGEYSFFSAYDEDSKSRVYEGIINQAPDSIETFCSAFAQSVQCVQLDSAEDAAAYKEAILPLIGDAADSVKAQVADAATDGKSELLNALMEESFNSSDEIVKKLNELTVLKEINTAKIWSEIAAVYTKYADALGIDTEAYEELDGKKKAMTTLIGEEFKTLEDAAEAFDEAVENQADKDNDSSSGGSGGSGGGGGGRGSVSIGGSAAAPAVPVVPVTQPEDKTDSSEVTFSDLAGFEWAEANIKALAAKGIINGYSDNTFAPGNYITRAEFVKLFVSAFGIEGDSEMSFDDVKADDWYYASVKAAYSAGYVNGVGENSFMPDAYITRQDIAVILNRYLKGGVKSDTAFADEGAISDYALDAVKALSGSKIINGYEDNTFRPAANATRAEVATVISRILREKGEI